MAAETATAMHLVTFLAVGICNFSSGPWAFPPGPPAPEGVAAWQADAVLATEVRRAQIGHWYVHMMLPQRLAPGEELTLRIRDFLAPNGAVTDFEPLLIGSDPLAVEQRYWDMYRLARQSPGGIAAQAIAGIELALWDIKAKSLGVPVYALFGGPTRSEQQVYWSHCGSSRARAHEIIGARTAIACHLLNQTYYNHTAIKWNPKKNTFASGGDPAWLTRDYRGDLEV